MIDPKITMEKTTEQLWVTVGDIVDYEIKVTNSSNIDVMNIKVSDMLDEHLEFIIGSVTINKVAVAGENITSGIMILKLNVGKSITIGFKVKVLDKIEDTILNQAFATYEYEVDGQKQFGHDESNINELPVSFVNLNIVKSTETTFAVLNDIVDYKVEILNDGEVEAKNVIFIDMLPKYVEFVPYSFKVNGRIVNSVNLKEGVVVPNIVAGEKLVITYSVKVTGTACNAKIINSASVKFNYELGSLVTDDKEIKQPEAEVSIDMGVSTFKQMSVEAELEIPVVKPDIESINEVTGTIDIVSCHLIETAAFVSQENQRLTGFKLSVAGILNTVIKYTAADIEQTVHSAHYEVPFSTFIVMPDGYKVGSKLDVEGFIEDIYFKCYNEREFFANTTLMINVKILEC